MRVPIWVFAVVCSTCVYATGTYSYDREYDTGFAMQLLGESWVASKEAFEWPRRSFSVQMQLRPLSIGQNSHFF